MRRLIFPVLLGVVGCGILISLGVWQLQRLQWKTELLAEISARIDAAPEALPDAAAVQSNIDSLRYQPVEISGRTTGAEVLVLTGKKGLGAGYEVISAFETTDGRVILVDRGFVPETDETRKRPAVAITVRGNLQWPDEADSYTPAPDLSRNLWFARDVASISEHLGTEPILVVAREVSGDAQGIEPVPVDTSGIPNDHREYAITWFLLAAVWAGMTGYLLWRIRQKTI